MNSDSKSYSLGRAGVVYTGLSLLRPATNVLVLPALVALMSPSELGIFMLMTPAWWMAQALLTLGANESLGRLVAGNRKGTSGALLLVVALITVLGLALLAVLSLLSSHAFPATLMPTIVHVVSLGSAQAIVATTVSTMRSRLEVQHASAVLLCSTLATIGGGLTFLLLSTPTAELYYAGAATGGWISAGLGVVLALKSVPHQRAGSWQAFSVSIRTGIPLVPQLVSPLVVDLGVRSLVAATAGLEALGTFGIALTVGSVFGLIVKAGFQAWSPVFFRLELVEALIALRKFSSNLLTSLLLLLSLLGCGLSLARATLSEFSIDPQIFIPTAIIAASASAPQVALTGLTQLGLYTHSTRHAGWTVVLGIMVGFLLAIGAGLIRWQLFALALPLGQVVSAWLYSLADRNRNIRGALRGRPLILLVSTLTAVAVMVTASLTLPDTLSAMFSIIILALSSSSVLWHSVKARRKARSLDGRNPAH